MGHQFKLSIDTRCEPDESDEYMGLAVTLENDLKTVIGLTDEYCTADSIVADYHIFMDQTLQATVMLEVEQEGKCQLLKDPFVKHLKMDFPNVKVTKRKG